LGLARRTLASETSYAFAGLFNKRKPLSKNLDHYDLIVIGCNMGGILSRQFDKVTHGKYKTMVVLD
jgi:sulfide:quinone oxidoreductase